MELGSILAMFIVDRCICYTIDKNAPCCFATVWDGYLHKNTFYHSNILLQSIDRDNHVR